MDLDNLIKCGFSLVKCDRKIKLPLELWGAETFPQHSGRNKGAIDLERYNIAIQCGLQEPMCNNLKIGVFDIDDKNGKNGSKMWAEMQEAVGELFPETVTVTTQTGGKHFYFLYSGNIGKRANYAGYRGVDLQADKSLVFCPPSCFEGNNGEGLLTGGYTWDRAPDLLEENLGIAVLPERWAAWIAEKQAKSGGGGETADTTISAERPAISDVELKKIELTLNCLAEIDEEILRKACGGNWREKWVQIGQALYSTHRVEAEQMFLDFSRRLPSFKNEKDVSAVWKSFKHDGVSPTVIYVFLAQCERVAANLPTELTEKERESINNIKSFRDNYVVEIEQAEAMEATGTGKKKKKVRAPTKDEIIEAIKSISGFENVRYNSIREKRELWTVDGEYLQEVGDAETNKIYLEIRDYQILYDLHKDYSKKELILAAFDEVAHRNKYDPIEEYLSKCHAKYIESPKNYIEEVCKVVSTSDEVFEKFFTKWICGAVAKYKYSFQNYVLVLQGKQGVGKGTFCHDYLGRNIMDYFQRGRLDPRNKDHKIALTRNLLWEVDEFTSEASRQQVNEFKSMVTLEEIDERAPYARDSKFKKVSCSFIATTNDEYFLFDMTGNRRFLTVCYDPIDAEKTMKELNKLDPDHVWGQAVEMTKTRDSSTYYLDKEERELSNTINENRRLKLSLEEYMEEIYEAGDEENYITIQELKLFLAQVNMQAYYSAARRILIRIAQIKNPKISKDDIFSRKAKKINGEVKKVIYFIKKI